MSAANLHFVNTWRHRASLNVLILPTEYLTSLSTQTLCDVIRRQNTEWGARQVFLAHASDWQTHWPVLSPIFTNHLPHKNWHWQEVGQRERKTKSTFLGDRYLRCLPRLQELSNIWEFTIKQTLTFALINLDGWTAIALHEQSPMSKHSKYVVPQGSMFGHFWFPATRLEMFSRSRI